MVLLDHIVQIPTRPHFHASRAVIFVGEQSQTAMRRDAMPACPQGAASDVASTPVATALSRQNIPPPTTAALALPPR
jgi:hypothetical protein